MSDRLEPMLPETTVLTYIGREEAASPAVGSKKVSDREESEIVMRALELPEPKPAEAVVAPAVKPPEVVAVPADANGKPADTNGKPAAPAAEDPRLEKIAHGSGIGGD
jgi:hypothetical protein